MESTVISEIAETAHVSEESTEESRNNSTNIVNYVMNDIMDAVFESVCTQNNKTFNSDEDKITKNSKIIVHSNIAVQSAWSQHLHWPKVEKTHTHKTPTAPMPFAITSKNWKEYAQAKDFKKKEKEDSILKRKAIRKRKNKRSAKRTVSIYKLRKKELEENNQDWKI